MSTGSAVPARSAITLTAKKVFFRPLTKEFELSLVLSPVAYLPASGCFNFVCKTSVPECCATMCLAMATDNLASVNGFFCDR